MQAVNVPPLLPLTWGQNAAGGTIRPIPAASQIGIQDGAASLNDGFPTLTLTPEASGGVPPFGQDANGILAWLSQINQWYQAGGAVTYNSAFATSVSGYPRGAVLQSSAVNGRFWLNTVDSNLTDPDSLAASGWVNFFAPVFVNATFTGTTTVNGPLVAGSTVNLGGSASAITQAQNDNSVRVATTAYVDRQAATTLAAAAADATTKANNAQAAAVAYANANFATPGYVNAQASAAQTNAYNAAVAYTNGYAATPAYVQSQFQVADNGSGALLRMGPCWIQMGTFGAVQNGSGTATLYTSFPSNFKSVVCTPQGSSGTNQNFVAYPVNAGQFNWVWPSTIGGVGETVNYIAAGY